MLRDKEDYELEMALQYKERAARQNLMYLVEQVDAIQLELKQVNSKLIELQTYMEI